MATSHLLDFCVLRLLAACGIAAQLLTHDFYLKKWQPSTCPSFHLSLTVSISHSSSRRHYKLKLKMFTPKVSRHESFSKHRAGKTGSKRQRSFKNSSFQRFEQAAAEVQHQQ